MTDWGDVATWVGAAGTWVVGVAAAILAWQQRPRFRPHFACFVSTQQPGLMVITIANRGAGSGQIDRIEAIEEPRGPLRRSWRGWGEEVPFTLAGRSSATVVVEGKHFSKASKVTLIAAGRESRTRSPKVLEEPMAATTVLPPGTPNPTVAAAAEGAMTPAVVALAAPAEQGGYFERLCRRLGI